ncbi:MAG: hypothetical protein Q9161_008280 [Pseudevernia consocians]
MLRRRRELKHTTGAKAAKRHTFSNAKERLKAFFHLERPLTADTRDARYWRGAVEPYCGGQFRTPTSSHPVDTSTRHGSTSHPTNHPSTFPFYALPPEIRNDIIRYVLVPGSIYLESLSGRWGLRNPYLESNYRRLTATLQTNVNQKILHCTRRIDKRLVDFPHPRFHKIGGSPSTQQPGIQILATSKELYAHGHLLFYTQNHFHLAPGPITISSHYFYRLQPQHRSLIRSFVLTFSVADLTPEGFQYVHHLASRYQESHSHAISSLPRDEQIATWITASVHALDMIWRQKLAWLKTWPGLHHLTSVTLDGGGGWEYDFEGTDLV